MTVKQRIAMVRFAEKIDKYPEYAKLLGIEIKMTNRREQTQSKQK